MRTDLGLIDFSLIRRSRGLRKRAERITKAISIMAERVAACDPEGMRTMLSDPELHYQLRIIETLPDRDLKLFLKILEEGLPEEIKRLV